MFQELYNLWANETDWKTKKSRFEDLRIWKRKRKQSWLELGASKLQARELDKFKERIK